MSEITYMWRDQHDHDQIMIAAGRYNKSAEKMTYIIYATIFSDGLDEVFFALPPDFYDKLGTKPVEVELSIKMAEE